jgi:hypothetical protein
MGESEWLTCTDPMEMLCLLEASGNISERKARLFLAACARSLGPVLGCGPEGVAAVYERHADGQASDEDVLRCLCGGMSANRQRIVKSRG